MNNNNKKKTSQEKDKHNHNKEPKLQKKTQILQINKYWQ